MNDIFSVYALYNQSRDKIYIGQTNDLPTRIARHNQLLPNRKKSYTSKNSGEWRLIYSEKYGTREEAVVREKQLKSFRGREFVRTLLKS